MKTENREERKEPSLADDLEVIKLFVSPESYRAFQRCVWVQVQETGCTQLDVMQTVVDEFLTRHIC